MVICGTGHWAGAFLDAARGSVEVVAVVDDWHAGKTTLGYPCLSTEDFLDLVAKRPEIVCLNTGQSHAGYGHFACLAEELGLKPLARFVSYAVGGVPPEIMGMGPVVAVPKALKLAGLTLDDIDIIELNEAFACQALAVMRELGLDPEKTNVNGGAVALGHPLGASGAKLTVQLLGEMRRRKSKYGMVTMCVGGGQGAATIFENLQ
jgi:acetyl-CoA acetyltransferase